MTRTIPAKQKTNTEISFVLPTESVKQINEISKHEMTTASEILRRAVFEYIRDREIKIAMHKAYLEGLLKWEKMKGASA